MLFGWGTCDVCINRKIVDICNIILSNFCLCQIAARPPKKNVEKRVKLRMKCELLCPNVSQVFHMRLESCYVLEGCGLKPVSNSLEFTLSKVFWGNWYTTYGLIFETQICLCQLRFYFLPNSFCRPKKIFNWIFLTLSVVTAQRKKSNDC